MRFHLITLGILFLFSSCYVTHNGSVSSGPLLSQTDTYQGVASGISKAVYVFGFGSLKNNQLVQDAKVNMYYRQPLHKNEYYSNYTTDVNKKIIFGIVDFTRVTVSADVMMKGDTLVSPFSLNFNHSITPYKSLSKNEVSKDTTKFNGNQLLNGDTVLYSYRAIPFQKYIVTSLDKESVILKACGIDYPTILVPLKNNSFFIQNRSTNGYKIYDKVKIDVIDSFDGRTLSSLAVIHGFCNNHVLIKNIEGYSTRKLSELKK